MSALIASAAVALATNAGAARLSMAQVGAVGVPTEPGAFVPLSPSRILDTRARIGIDTDTPIPGQSEVPLQVTGQGGVPSSGVSAVVMNVTVTRPTRNGYVTVYPTGEDLPVVSNVNFAAGQTFPNLVTVKVGAGGKVTLFNGQIAGESLHLIADIAGYYLAPPGPQVTDAEVDAVTTSSVTLRWTNPRVDGFTGVTIRRAVGTTAPATPTDGNLAVQTSGPVNLWTDTGLTPGQTYSYALFAQINNAFAPAAVVTLTIPTMPSLTGTVTGANGPVSGVAVDVVDVSTGIEAARVRTAADGTYAVAGLAPGQYTVCFSPAGAASGPGGLGYLPQCWNNISPAGTPDPVTVTAGTTTVGVDAALVTAGSISGTVTNSSGAPVAGVIVSVDKPGGDPVMVAITDDQGQWSVSGLPSGSYGVCFNPSNVDGDSYVAQCYDNTAPDSSPTLVAVTEGSAVTDIDAVLVTAAAAGALPADRRAAPVLAVSDGIYPSTSLSSLACADVLFLGARGSGVSGPGGVKLDPNDTNYGLGGPVRTAYDAFVSSITDGRSVTRPVSVSYPADNIPGLTRPDHYIPDLWKGVAEVRRSLIDRSVQCPNERIVLAGYSQGAMVMHRVLTNATGMGVNTTLPDAILRRVDAAILIADGDRVANDRTNNYGTAGDSAQGIGTQLDFTAGMSKLPRWIGAGVYSVCDASDSVCNFRVPYLCAPCDLIFDIAGIAPHMSAYTDRPNVIQAARAAAARVQTFPAVGGTAIQVTGTVGQHVSQQLHAYATGDVIWALAPGSQLPEWMSLSTSGLVTGTPTTPGTVDLELMLSAVNQDTTNTVLVLATVSILPAGLPTSWSGTELPRPQGYSIQVMRALVCPAEMSCYAIAGYNNSRSALLRFSDGLWEIMGFSTNTMYDIACSSVTSCVAVGQGSNNSSYIPVMWVISGDSWTVVAPPLPEDFGLMYGGRFAEVTCPSSTRCVAAGGYLSVSDGTKAFVVSGSGDSWTMKGVTLPPDGRGDPPRIFDIACASVTSCVAVGEYPLEPFGTASAPLLLFGEGDSWHSIRLPDEEGRTVGGVLRSVSCPSPTQCVAVGRQTGGLIVTGFGSSWVSHQAPVPSGANEAGLETLGSVSCSETSCTVVGTYQTVDWVRSGMLITGWGSSWSAQSVAPPGEPGAEYGSYLALVDCPQSGSCLALGGYGHLDQPMSQPVSSFVTSSSGETWLSTSLPRAARWETTVNDVLSLDCPSVRFCAVAGKDATTSQVFVLVGPGPG